MESGVRRRRAALALVAICLVGTCAVALICGCARRGNPVAPNGESTGYRLVTTFPIVGYAESVQIEGDLGLVAAGEGGLVILDMSDPAQPAYLGKVPTYFTVDACSIAPIDSMVYATDGRNGAVSIDISDPEAPALHTVLESTSGQDVIAVETVPGERHIVYVADREGGFRIWELTYYAPWWIPSPIRHDYTDGHARGLCLHGDLILIACGPTGLTIYDVSDPYAAQKLADIDTPGNAWAVAASGSYAYVADGLKGLQVIDISLPDAPELVASFDTGDYASDVAYRDGMVFVADENDGLRAINVTDPLAPAEAGYFETPYANGVYTTDSYIYVADRDWGLVVIEEEYTL